MAKAIGRYVISDNRNWRRHRGGNNAIDRVPGDVDAHGRRGQAGQGVRAVSLEFGIGGVSHRFTASELLARPDVAEVDIPDDHDYRRATHYRVVPLLPLLAGLSPDRFDTLEARATDGFVAQIPLSLVRKGAEGGATAWIAVEPPDQPWPNLPGKNTGAGPFYLVWEHPERSGVTSEQWPYQLASLTAVEGPAAYLRHMAQHKDVASGQR